MEPCAVSDTRRLAVLENYKVLNTLPEKEYDDLAIIAACICECPVGMVNFVGADQVFFKAKVGMPPEVQRYPFATNETKNASFCVGLIQSQSALFTVHDALEEEKYLFCSFVSCPNPIRFYAGASVIAPSGEHLGSLCVIDYKPRILTKEQNEALVRLAHQVVSLLELRKTNILLKNLVEEKTSFLGMLSHDLRQPLCSIQVCTELLLRELHNEEATELLEGIFSSSSMMLQLTNRLLRVAKATTSADLNVITQATSERACNFTRLLGRVVATNSRLALGKNIAVSLEMEGDPKMELHVAMDPVSLEQVINNILSNAIKFSPPNSRIRVAIRSTPAMASVSITDEGPGIPVHERSLLWQPYRSTSVLPTAGEKSTGLGLYIAKRLIERQHGTITCDSIVGNGSTFCVSLPIAPEDTVKALEQQHATQASLNIPSASSGTKKRSRQPLHVLVADDDSLNRRILQSLFARSGHSCTTVVNGQEAYDAVYRNPSLYDAVLLDLLMPIMNGDSAAALLQQLPQVPKIFLISGADVEELQGHCDRLRLAGYFWKPFSSKIVEEVERRVDARSDRQTKISLTKFTASS